VKDPALCELLNEDVTSSVVVNFGEQIFCVLCLLHLFSSC
jgi:hypothetical protein